MKRNPSTGLKFKEVDEGSARIYFTRDKTKLICFQEDYPNQFTLYSCSRDGEPSHPLLVDPDLLKALMAGQQYGLGPTPDSPMTKRFWTMVQLAYQRSSKR